VFFVKEEICVLCVGDVCPSATANQRIHVYGCTYSPLKLKLKTFVLRCREVSVFSRKKFQILLKFDMEDIQLKLLEISVCLSYRSLMKLNLHKAINSLLHIGSFLKTFQSFCFDLLCKMAGVK
jgi:hypothetical protein